MSAHPLRVPDAVPLPEPEDELDENAGLDPESAAIVTRAADAPAIALDGDASVSPAATTPAKTRARPRQLTARALIVGCGIGAVLAAGNVYTGLKSGFVDAGALTAALLAFTFFATFKRLARLPFGPFENNVAQTAASSAAIMSFVHGLMGPMPALALMGHPPSGWALWGWGISLALVGITVAAVLRRKLVIDEALPFPSGIATAELIRTVHKNQGSASRRTRLLVIAALTAAALTWLRDAWPNLVPQAIYFPGAIVGMTGAALTLGLASSPLMAATGIFIGTRAALTLFLGGLVSWAILAPRVVAAGWVKDGSYATLTAWLVWPAVGVLLSGTLVPVLLGWRRALQVVGRVARDMKSLLGRASTTAGVQAGAPAPRVEDTPGRRPGWRWLGAGAVLAGTAGAVWIGSTAFDLSPVMICLALLLSAVLGGVCARAAGETDIAPVGSFGMLTQIVFSGSGTRGSVLSGAIIAGTAAQTAQGLWSYKAGHSLRASTRAQLTAQALGTLVGSAVVVPTYLLVIRVYPLGSERMPAASALSWRATAEAVTNGLAGLPTHGLHAALIGLAAGTLLAVCARTRIGRFLPSPMALGIALITPVSLSAAALLGAVAMTVARRRVPSIGDGDASALAAGALAGESIVGVLIAMLASLGVLTP